MRLKLHALQTMNRSPDPGRPLILEGCRVAEPLPLGRLRLVTPVIRSAAGSETSTSSPCDAAHREQGDHGEGILVGRQDGPRASATSAVTSLPPPLEVAVQEGREAV